ncbi:methyltransferase domain-containing protein [Brevundimonas sp. SH203]|uniref:methyltransferase domain-containing protein n=1 Tax=Brevundimonas sp. SH203 TaxID=345167 RepID=UPI0035D0DE7B
MGFSSYGDARVVPIVHGAIGVDIDYPGYDGKHLPFDDDSQDTVYSSHCLEHISDPLSVIQDWHRVTKIGGHIIIAVPSRDLFERRRRPHHYGTKNTSECISAPRY